MTATRWMVLNEAQDRILSRTPSLLEAVRDARRVAGSPARLERASGFGVAVHGPDGNLTVFRALVDDGQGASAVMPGMSKAELIALPAGGSFIWVPGA